jgi:hypothetical protein
MRSMVRGLAAWRRVPPGREPPPSATFGVCHLPARGEAAHATFTKLSITRFLPLVSNSISSLLPS